MTTFLLRRFVSGWDAPDTPGVRTAVGRLSGMVGILCNLLLFAAKLLIGTLSGALSICADAMNNLTDAGSSILVFIGYVVSAKPADKEHPYGHARMEYICSLFISVIVTVLGIELLRSSAESFFGALKNGGGATYSIVTVVVMLVTALGKLSLPYTTEQQRRRSIPILSVHQRQTALLTFAQQEL